MWQLLAIVAIAALALLWFIRDERRRMDRALAAKAHYFATTPAYRPTVATKLPAVVQKPARSKGLRETDRAYFDRMMRENAAR